MLPLHQQFYLCRKIQELGSQVRKRNCFLHDVPGLQTSTRPRRFELYQEFSRVHIQLGHTSKHLSHISSLNFDLLAAVKQFCY